MSRDWNEGKLGDFITLKRGYDLPVAERNRNGNIPIVSSSGFMDYHDEAKADAPGVVTGRYGTVGEIYFVDVPYWPLNTALYVQDFKGNYPLFIYYFLQILDFNRYSDKTSVPGVNRNDLHRINVSVPPVEEQRKIAAILGTWDRAIGLVEALIAALQNRKKGLMQLLLTGQVRFPEFDGEWEEVQVGDIADVRGGKRLPKGRNLVSYDTGYPYIRVSNMREQGVDTKNIMYVPEDVAPQIRAYRIFKEDIYISVAGTIGLIGKIPVELDGANLTENADRLTNIQINRQYLLHALKSSIIEEQINQVLTTNAQPKLALTRIRDFKIPLPSASEQEKIANIIDLVNSGLDVYICYQNRLQQQKKGLIQQLLTGQVRV